MSLPAIHKLPMVHISAYMADMSSATVPTSSAYIRVPFRCTLDEASVTPFGAITSANAVITISQNGTTINGADSNGTTANVLTILSAGAAAGIVVTYAPSSVIHCVKGDYISFVSNHASSTATPATCEIGVRPE